MLHYSLPSSKIHHHSQSLYSLQVTILMEVSSFRHVSMLQATHYVGLRVYRLSFHYPSVRIIRKRIRTHCPPLLWLPVSREWIVPLMACFCPGTSISHFIPGRGHISGNQNPLRGEQFPPTACLHAGNCGTFLLWEHFQRDEKKKYIVVPCLVKEGSFFFFSLILVLFLLLWEKE